MSVDVTGSAAGMYLNTSDALGSDVGFGSAASDTLTVLASPGFSKTFAPDSIVSGGVSTLTFTIDSSANVAAVGNLEWTDLLPAGVVVAPPPNVSNSCLATVTANAGAGSIDIAVSPQQVTIGALLTHIRRGNMVRVHSLRRGAAEAIEAVALGDKRSSKVVGRAIEDIDLPPGTTIPGWVNSIEIGGWVKFSSRLPAPFMLKDLVHRNAMAILFAAKHTPQITLEAFEVKKLEKDLYRVRTRLINSNAIPSMSAYSQKKNLYPKDILKVSGRNARVSLTTTRRPVLANSRAADCSDRRLPPICLARSPRLGG